MPEKNTNEQAPDVIGNTPSEAQLDLSAADGANESVCVAEDGEQISLVINEAEDSAEAHPDEDLSEDAEEEEQKGLLSSLMSLAAPYDPEKPRKIDGWFEFIELFVFTIAAVFVMISFIFSHSVVDGESMLGTLENGDRLIISNLFYTPSRGDIIVVAEEDKTLVKRIIALGGETIEITSGGAIYIDGELLEEDYVYIGTPGYKYTPLKLTVPVGEVFYLGDHRDDSRDSRYYGTVDEDAIIGKAIFRFFPFDRFGSVYDKEGD